MYLISVKLDGFEQLKDKSDKLKLKIEEIKENTIDELIMLTSKSSSEFEIGQSKHVKIRNSVHYAQYIRV